MLYQRGQTACIFRNIYKMKQRPKKRLDLVIPVDYSRRMDINHALIAFSALSQETRLLVLKLLLEYGKTGVAAGDISKALCIPHNTLSFHLSHLAHAGLVSSRKAGRSIIYSADTDAVESLIDYLKDNCCVREAVASDCALAAAPKIKGNKNRKLSLSCC